MVERLVRAVGVAINGSIVPVPGSAIRSERPTGERDLYRQLAMIARSDAGIARAASRWGPIAGGSAFLGPVAPVLGAMTAPIRDRLARSAERWAGLGDDDGPDGALFEATAASMDNVMAVVGDRLVTALEMTEDDLRAIASQVATPMSPGGIVPAMVDAVVRVRQARYPPTGKLPRWVREFDALGDPTLDVDRLAGAMDAVGAASTPGELAAAMSGLQVLLTPLADVASLMDDASAAGLLSPLIDLIEHMGASEPSTSDPPAEQVSASARRVFVPALFAYWRAGDTPGLPDPVELPVPKLADPDTWRSVLILAGAMAARAMGTGDLLVPQERARDWQDLSMECALWRDALDRLRVAEQPRSTASEHSALRVALSDLARRLGPRLGLPATDLTALDARDTETIRSRLVRWITARCAIGGVEPRPRSGLVGTEGRALWSIHDALSETTLPRRCEWPEGCDELLPPRAYAHRRNCDLHRREASRGRMRRWRQATQP